MTDTEGPIRTIKMSGLRESPGSDSVRPGVSQTADSWFENYSVPFLCIDI